MTASPAAASFASMAESCWRRIRPRAQFGECPEQSRRQDWRTKCFRSRPSRPRSFASAPAPAPLSPLTPPTPLSPLFPLFPLFPLTALSPLTPLTPLSPPTPPTPPSPLPVGRCLMDQGAAD